MNRRDGCGQVALGCLFVLVALLVFVALAAGLFLTGEAPLYAPRLTGFQPAPNETFQPSTPITLTFDQPMDPASVRASFALVPSVPGTFRWNEQRTRFTFVPNAPGYEPGRTYKVRLAPGVKAGTLPRTTEQGIEWDISLLPLLESMSPPSGQINVGALPQFQATFNYTLDCDLTPQTFLMSPAAAGDVACQDRTLTFTPTQPLAPDTAYSAAFAHVFLIGDTSPRPGVAWEFTTAPALSILEASPAAGETLVDLWTAARITFNRPVLPSSVPSRFSLVTGDGLSVSGQIAWEDDGATFVFRPDPPLKPATGYEMALQKGVQDMLAFELADGLSRSFRTADMLGVPAPMPDAVDVALDSSIRIPFTRPMNEASVEAGLTITPSVEGQMTWEGDTLVLVPKGGLAADTRYEVALSADIRDVSGAPLAEERRWTFSTLPFLLDADVPSGPALVTLQKPITFTFALPMDRANVQAALTISPTTSGQLAWSDGDRTVTFQPDPAWLAGASYEITLAGTARTADGAQALVQDRAWTFATGVAQIQFGEGPNVQVMDYGGNRAFQITIQGADVADFCLYAITPTQFLDLYSSGFRGIGPQEPRIIDTTGLTATVKWREAPARLDDQAYEGWPASGTGGWRVAEAHLPAQVPPGMYILASLSPVGGTESGQANSQLLVILTRHVLVLKRALAGSGSRTQAQIVAWDTELSSGAPVVSATIRLYDRDGTFLSEGLTGPGGLLALDVPGDPGPLLAFSEASGDVTVCGLSDEWNEMGLGWWGWWAQPPSRPLYTTYSYTDRPIYRPGQTIYLKDFVRANDDVSYTLPAPSQAGATGSGPPITVRLRDARDNVAATQVLTANEFGTVHGEFQLADEPMLGTWNLETEVEGAITRQPLKVEEYRKPEYDVTVEVAQQAYVSGESISVTVDAAYYFGPPVGGAGVELAVYPTYPDEYYSDEQGTRFGHPIFTEQAHLDNQGHWMGQVPTDQIFSYRENSQRAVLALEATVTDDAGQSVSSYQTVVVQRTSVGLSLLLERHGYQPGEEIAFTATVLGRSGEPVAGTELTAQMLGWDDGEVAGATATTGDNGKAYFAVTLAEQGWYRLVVSGTDDGGREVATEEWLWAYDPSGQAHWYRGQWGGEQTLSVSADRAAYAVGDEAQLVIYAPVAGPALLTFERGETHDAEPIELISGTNLISVPIRADYAPNVYVSISQFGPVDEGGYGWWPEMSRPEAQLHTASAELLVPMADRLLTVTLTPGQETFAPGEEATFHVQVANHQGQPVVAEVSLAVVDEAIYALAEDLSRDPFDVFYSPRPDLVRTFDSLRPTRWLYPAGGMGGGEGEAAGAPRRTFLDTAYWAPTVVTDPNGEATVTFSLPDNLTEWRALARAVTTDTLVGGATARVVVSQDIVIRPALPRFVVQGDAITLTAVVHNFTAQPVSATAELAVEGLVPLGEQGSGQTGLRVVDVPAGGSATVDWPVVAAEPGEALVTVGVTAGRGTKVVGRDVVQLPLPVHPLAVPEIATLAGDLTPSRPTSTFTITLPSDAIEGLSRLEINLAPSIAPGLLDGLEYLIDYPFG